MPARLLLQAARLLLALSPEARACMRQALRAAAACPDQVDPRMMMRLARMTALGGRGHPPQIEVRADPDLFNRVRAFAKLQLSDAELKDWT